MAEQKPKMDEYEKHAAVCFGIGMPVVVIVYYIALCLIKGRFLWLW